MTSATSGPLLGAFLLAILVPVANWKGTAIGMVMSHIITLWITFGHLFLEKTTQFLDTSIEGCTNGTFSSEIVKPFSHMMASLPQNLEVLPIERAETSAATSHLFPQNIYAVSYMYYSLIGTLITVVIGTIVSYLTFSKDDAYESKLIHPMVYKFCMMIPGTNRFFSDHSDQTEIIDDASTRSSFVTESINHGLDLSKEKSVSVHTISETVNYEKNGLNNAKECQLKKYEKTPMD
jgi:hypothetical protein